MAKLQAFLGLRGSILGIVVFTASGCGPEVSDAELGQIEQRLPEVSEIGDAYELPDLSPEEPTPASAEDEAEIGEKADSTDAKPGL